MNYDVDYFIAKFEAIPEDLFNVGYQHKADGTHCSLGWCNQNHSAPGESEYYSLGRIFNGTTINIIKNISGNTYDIGISNTAKVAAINNGETKEYQQSTPKKRILAALYDIKKLQVPKEKVIIKYVSVDNIIKKEAEELVTEN